VNYHSCRAVPEQRMVAQLELELEEAEVAPKPRLVLVEGPKRHAEMLAQLPGLGWKMRLLAAAGGAPKEKESAVQAQLVAVVAARTTVVLRLRVARVVQMPELLAAEVLLRRTDCPRKVTVA
jgi:hypothetical protein